MNLYLDDDSAKGTLVARLRNTGHHIVLPADASLGGAADPRHLLYAVQHGLQLRDALESLLSHAHRSFQLLISDNAKCCAVDAAARLRWRAIAGPS